MIRHQTRNQGMIAPPFTNLAYLKTLLTRCSRFERCPSVVHLCFPSAPTAGVLIITENLERRYLLFIKVMYSPQSRYT
jgi:hypothetical protein